MVNETFVQKAGWKKPIGQQVILGEKNLKEGNVELKIRKTGERIIVKKEDAVNKVLELINDL